MKRLQLMTTLILWGLNLEIWHAQEESLGSCCLLLIPNLPCFPHQWVDLGHIHMGHFNSCPCRATFTGTGMHGCCVHHSVGSPIVIIWNAAVAQTQPLLPMWQTCGCNPFSLCLGIHSWGWACWITPCNSAAYIEDVSMTPRLFEP